MDDQENKTPEAAGEPVKSDPVSEGNGTSFVEIGEKLFKSRDYTPIPIIVILLFVAEPSIFTATIGTLMVVLGELIRIYSVAFIGSISRTRSDNVGAELVITGPFAWTRNPLYIGNFFIAGGMVVFGGVGWLILITAIAFAFQYHAIVKYEESNLKKQFGTDFEEYLKVVPPWLPRNVPPLKGWQWPTDFSPALKSEKRTLTAIALMLAALVLIGN